MTGIPRYLTYFPNMHSSYPFHISLNRLPKGFPAHRHDFLEFSYVVEGSGSESVNGVKHRMIPGTFTFVLPYQVHELFTDPGSNLVLFNCMFGMDLLMQPGAGSGNAGLGSLLDSGDDEPFLLLDPQSRDVMKSLMADLYAEYKGDAWGRTTLLQAKLTEALVLFHRCRSGGTSKAAAAIPGGKSERSVWPIIHFLHQHYTEDGLSLAELAGRFSMSVSRISEVIKEKTGQSYVQLLHDLRIRHAVGLMGSTDMSITEIAHEAGYGSYKTFSRIFRERKGVVPTEYRRAKAKGEFLQS